MGTQNQQPAAFCTECGSRLIPGARFCGNCGKPLWEPEPPAQEPAAPVQAAPVTYEPPIIVPDTAVKFDPLSVMLEAPVMPEPPAAVPDASVMPETPAVPMAPSFVTEPFVDTPEAPAFVPDAPVTPEPVVEVSEPAPEAPVVDLSGFTMPLTESDAPKTMIFVPNHSSAPETQPFVPETPVAAPSFVPETPVTAPETPSFVTEAPDAVSTAPSFVTEPFIDVPEPPAAAPVVPPYVPETPVVAPAASVYVTEPFDAAPAASVYVTEPFDAAPAAPAFTQEPPSIVLPDAASIPTFVPEAPVIGPVAAPVAPPQQPVPEQAGKKKSGRGVLRGIATALLTIPLIAFAVLTLLLAVAYRAGSDLALSSGVPSIISDLVGSLYPVIIGGVLAALFLMFIVWANIHRIRRAFLAAGISSLILGVLCIVAGLMPVNVLTLPHILDASGLDSAARHLRDLALPASVGALLLGAVALSVYFCIRAIKKDNA